MVCPVTFNRPVLLAALIASLLALSACSSGSDDATPTPTASRVPEPVDVPRFQPTPTPTTSPPLAPTAIPPSGPVPSAPDTRLFTNSRPDDLFPQAVRLPDLARIRLTSDDDGFTRSRACPALCLERFRFMW